MSYRFFLFILVGAVIGVGLTLLFSNSNLFGQYALFFTTPTPEVTTPTETQANQTSQTDIWQSIIIEANRSSVAVQVFQGERLVRSGSGIIVSSDGLALTSYDTTYTGQVIYQVVVDDKIVRAGVVARSYKDNLALLKMEGSDFNIARLDEKANYESGRDVIITGLIVDLSNTTNFVQKAMIQYHKEKEILLDVSAKPFFNGAQIVDSKGESLGIASVRNGKVLLIPTSRINEFINKYLATLK